LTCIPLYALQLQLESGLIRGDESESHVGAPFVATFGETLSMLRKLFQTTDASSQPFVISGSGTLGWDLVAANLAEPGDDVLVLHTGYFADSFADCFETYGVKATQLKAPIGSRRHFKRRNTSY
jgi:alanine-glyoxylate transaminase/serine-glyoxylate transaminase/serine-pyruvate transaminase